MEKFNEATHNRPDGERTLDDYFVHVDLPRYMRDIKEEVAWQKNDRNAITVFKTDNISVVLVAMHQGARIDKQQAQDMLCIQVLEGMLQFTVEDKFATLAGAQMVMLHKGYSYSLVADDEAMFLMTISHNSGRGI